MKFKWLRYKSVRWVLRRLGILLIISGFILSLLIFNTTIKYPDLIKNSSVVSFFEKVEQNKNNEAFRDVFISIKHKSIGQDENFLFTVKNKSDYTKFQRLIELIYSSEVLAENSSTLSSYRVHVNLGNEQLKFTFSQSSLDSKPALRNFLRLLKQYQSE
jgi:hypothetical protein